MLLSEVVSTVFQVFLFLAIPFFAYLVRFRKLKGFKEYIGFHRPPPKAVYYSVLGALLSVISFAVSERLIPGMKKLLSSPALLANQLAQAGSSWDILLLILLISLVKTSLSEEILFRGFIGKRLIDRFGFQIGNTTQAVLFGSVHGILLKSTSAGQGITTASIILVVVLTGIAGYLLGYLTEKPANGSIIPAWIAHGLVNALSYSTAVFLS